MVRSAQGTGDVPAGPDPSGCCGVASFQNARQTDRSCRGFDVLWPRFLWVFAALEVTGTPALPPTGPLGAGATADSSLDS